MKKEIIVSKMNKYLQLVTEMLNEWLGDVLPKTGAGWWEDCVIDSLSLNQRKRATEEDYSTLKEFDLAELLRIADKSWYAMRSVIYLHSCERDCIQVYLTV